MTSRVAGLFPVLGPWATLALHHGFGDTAPSPVGDLDDELDLICEQKLAPLLLRAAAARDLLLTPQQRRRLELDASARIVRSLRMSRLEAATTADLTDRGIGVVTTKGAGLASHYREPWTRTWTDVDLVVAPTLFAAAYDALTAVGWQESSTLEQPWPGFNRWCRESVNLVADRLTSVDLHHRPSPWLWGQGLDGTSLSRVAEPQPDGSRWASGPDNLAVAGLQLIADHRDPGHKLIAWRDLAELGASLEPLTTAERLRSTCTAGLVGHLLRELPSALRPIALAEELTVDAMEHGRRLSVMLRAARQGRVLVSHTARLPAPRAALFLAGTLFPSTSFLAARLPDPSRRRRRWWEALAAGDGLATVTTDPPAPAPAPADPTSLRLRDDVLQWGIDEQGSVAVRDTRDGTRLAIRGAWATAWSALADGASVDDLVTAQVAVHGTDRSQARAEVVTLVAMLRSRDQLTGAV